MRTRFAPSPTGLLHLGHAYSAKMAFDLVDGRAHDFVLRIEDIDLTRCREEFEQAIYDDLTWLGLKWEKPVRRQSRHFEDYKMALTYLEETGLIYPCFCTRKDIQNEIAYSPSAPHGPDGPVYPGICKSLSPDQIEELKASEKPYALRLHMDKAIAKCGALTFHDHEAGIVQVDGSQFGDIVLARKDTPTSYHLSVVVDDAFQKITDIVRGKDLFHATHIHRILQTLLHLPEPHYHHHKLLLDADGQRFAKRNKSVTIQSLREQGFSPAEVCDMMGQG